MSFWGEISEGVSGLGLRDAERKSAIGALSTENKKLIKCVKNNIETERVKNSVALLTGCWWPKENANKGDKTREKEGK